MTAKKIAEYLRKNPSTTAIVEPLKTNGWLFGFTRNLQPDGSYLVIFSASLWPKGRGSSEHDWRFLGWVSAAIEMPEEAMEQITKQQDANPNAVLKGVWLEEVQ